MSNNYKEEYNEYIFKSVKWKQKREECFAIYGRKCLLCNKKKKLHVHHKTYKRFRDERVETDLIPLCEKHHSNLHKYCKKHNRPLWQGSEEYIKKNRQTKKRLKRFKKKKQLVKKKRKKKASGKCGVRNFKYRTLPNDMDNFKAVVSISLED